MKRRNWTTTTSHTDGETIRLYEYDTKARAALLIERLTCTCWLYNQLGWLWKIPTRPGRDEDGYLRHSVGSALWTLENAIGMRVWRYTDDCLVRSVPISREAYLALQPDMAFLFEEGDA